MGNFQESESGVRGQGAGSEEGQDLSLPLTSNL